MDYSILIMCGVFSLIGVWAIVHPEGILGWIKQAHPDLDERDPSAHSVVKFIGAWFIILPAAIFLVALLNRYRH